MGYDAAGGRPPTGGVFRLFRRWYAGKGRAALSFSLVEELFGPSRHEARIMMEEQQRVGRLAPAPTDPPELPEPDPAAVIRPTGRSKQIVVAVPRAHGPVDR